MMSKVLIAILCALLGFALVTQLKSRDEADLASLSEADLARVLDSLGERSTRLHAQKSRLEAEQRELSDATKKEEAARDAAARRYEEMGILSGTLPAQGPGITLTVKDPAGNVSPTLLLSAIHELRDAGAEVIALNDTRIVGSSAFTGQAGSITIIRAGTKQAISPPYTLVAIGDAPTMTTALRIRGGVIASLTAKDEVSANISTSASTIVTATID